MSEFNEGDKKVILALIIGLGFIITGVALLGLTIIGLTWLANAVGL